MISLKMHGAWVRLKSSTLEGRIAYYDTKTKQVWVVWEMGKYTLNGHQHRMKQPSASGNSAKELIYMKGFEHAGWFK